MKRSIQPWNPPLSVNWVPNTLYSPKMRKSTPTPIRRTATARRLLAVRSGVGLFELFIDGSVWLSYVGSCSTAAPYGAPRPSTRRSALAYAYRCRLIVVPIAITDKQDAIDPSALVVGNIQ